MSTITMMMTMVTKMQWTLSLSMQANGQISMAMAPETMPTPTMTATDGPTLSRKLVAQMPRMPIRNPAMVMEMACVMHRILTMTAMASPMTKMHFQTTLQNGMTQMATGLATMLMQTTMVTESRTTRRTNVVQIPSMQNLCQ